MKANVILRNGGCLRARHMEINLRVSRSVFNSVKDGERQTNNSFVHYQTADVFTSPEHSVLSKS